MKRDFTFVDDIVSGIYGAIKFNPKQFHKIYNLGNSKSELLLEFIKLIEDNLGKNAKKNYYLFQPGDVTATFANISESQKDLKFKPKLKLLLEFRNLSHGIKSIINSTKLINFFFVMIEYFFLFIFKV